MVKLNKIYTRTGDDGTTGLVAGPRREKFDLRIDAFGTVDEVNSALGLARLHTSHHPELDAMLEHQLEVIDEEERVEEVHDIQRYIIENVMNPIPVWNYNTSTLLSARVRDYFPDDLYGYWEFRLVWLDQG